MEKKKNESQIEYLERMVHHIKSDRDTYKKAVIELQKKAIDHDYEKKGLQLRNYKVMFQRDILIAACAGLLYLAGYSLYKLITNP